MAFSKVKPSVSVVNFRRPKLFSSANTRKIVENDGATVNTTGKVVSNTNIQSSESFRYDSPGTGLKSTQQLPVNWTNFENHTFFNSAEAKVNVAFDRIINEYPFDGTQIEVEAYIDSLTGFEKWVLDEFPKNRGFLIFPSGGTSFISVADFAGSRYPALSKLKTGEKILDPGALPISIELHLLVTGASNVDQVICQNVRSASGDYFGYTIGLNATSSLTSGSVFLLATSGARSMSASYTIPKGEFNNLVFTLDRRPGVNQAKIYKNAVLVSTSTSVVEMGKFGFTTEMFNIASGTKHQTWTPASTFAGAIDELRIFHSVKTELELLQNAKKGIYASDELKLYLKFNEPTGSLGDLDNIALDSSGNSLHSLISNFTGSMRTTGSYAVVPITYEKLDSNPVLFPNFSDVVALNSLLLTSASLFDDENPNLITKLVPKHILWEGQFHDGFQKETGEIGDAYSGTGIPGTGEIGSTQLMISFLYVWAKQFDEMKLFIDQFSNLLFAEYDEDDFVADQFLPALFKYYGFSIPNLFTDASIDQFFAGENIGMTFNTSTALSYVQNQIWRRILTNLGEITRAKGTTHSIKSFLRSVGINPDNSFRIREFGGSTTRNLIDSRQVKSEVSTLLDMSGTLTGTTTTNAQGIPASLPFLQSPFLSSSRTEVGYPGPRGTFVSKPLFPIHGISNNASDGLLTSGSFTYEGFYKFEALTTGSHFPTQSLVRFASTGSTAAHLIWANLLAISGSASNDSKIKLYARPSDASAAPLLELALTGINIFDGNQWNVSFGRQRNDAVNSITSGSWFLRAGRQSFGETVESQVTCSYYFDQPGGAEVLKALSSSANASGSFFLIGSQSITTNGTLGFLNSSSFTGSEVRASLFSGKLGHVRFWSKALSETEWDAHVRSFKSIGVTSPRVNFNFVTQETGSFERLRVDVSTDQSTTSSDGTGNVTLFDYSQNRFHLSGTGFEANKRIIKPETFYYSFVSPRFDEASTDNKIRVRSFLQDENANRFGTAIAPLYEIPANEKPNDDTRFSIDFSVIDSLNEDIVKMFSTLDAIDNALGDPALLYSDDYPKLNELRDVYFNRLTDKVNLRSFFEFFKWFDTSIGMFIEQLIPRKANFLGTNFVIESHMLERAKIRYISDAQYVGEDQKFASVTTSFQDLETTLG